MGVSESECANFVHPFLFSIPLIQNRKIKSLPPWFQKEIKKSGCLRVLPRMRRGSSSGTHTLPRESPSKVPACKRTHSPPSLMLPILVVLAMPTDLLRTGGGCFGGRKTGLAARGKSKNLLYDV